MFLKGKNSLSSLLGNYMSDSENEDLNDQRQTPSNSFTKEVDSLLDEITKQKNDTDSVPVTSKLTVSIYLISIYSKTQHFCLRLDAMHGPKHWTSILLEY